MDVFLGPAVLHGYDSLEQTFGDDDCINPSFLDLQYPPEMTRNHDAGFGFTGQQSALDLSSWTLDLSVDGQSFPPTQYLAAAGHDAAKSPGRHSQQHSSGRSEATGSPASQIVYTPSSSHEYDVPNEYSDRALDDEDDASKSPLSDSIFSSTTDSSGFFMVNRSDSAEALETGRPVSLMNTRPQHSTPGASASSSRAPSVAKSSTPNQPSSAPWNATLTAPNGVMSNNTSANPSGSFGNSDDLSFPSAAFSAEGYQSLQYDWVPDLSTPNHGATTDLRSVTHNSFRPFEDAAQPAFSSSAYTAGLPFNQNSAPSQQLREQQHYFANQYQRSHLLFPQQQVRHSTPRSIGNYEPSTIPATASLLVEHPMAVNTTTTMTQGSMPIRSQPSQIIVHQPHQPSSTRSVPYPQAYPHGNDQVSNYQHSHHRRTYKPAIGGNTSMAPSRRVHLAPREDQRFPVVPSNAPAATFEVGASRKGGRARHTHLPDDVRQRTSKMRGVTACWRCALQRDKCDDGDVCRRCTIRSQKGQRDLFGCDRSKLPEWIDDLLPFSMTDMHSKNSIEKYVGDQVTRWNTNNSIDIYLTSGYGPPLIWRCCEFQPKDQELLGQLQYLQETRTGTEQRRMKYSPPFALEKLDESDDAHFQSYLDTQLMHPDWLSALGFTFYEEECIVDPRCFQAQVLQFMCTLFTDTKDPQLREALHDIIRMLIVTYIMGHTLTIAEDTLPTVLASVRYTPRQSRPEKHTSPRLANRQLKHYFSSLRNNTFNKVLHRQQQTFHDSKKKEAHWLVSFCAMLGLAMVLEEIQRTIQIQADAKWAKGEMSQEDANAEALGHCQGIDGKFERLTLFFQKKYRDRKWGDDGSFGRGTPNYRTIAESSFLSSLYELLVQRQDHLRSREDIPLGPQYQCKYTTRLVAKFLLPFLNLAT